MRPFKTWIQSVPVLVCVLFGGNASGAAVSLVSGIMITARAQIKPGTYRIQSAPDGAVTVSGENFDIDFSGATLIGPGANQGIGIHITHASHVFIKDVHVRGYLWGIVIDHCEDVQVVGSSSSFNADLPAGTVIDESGREPEDTHGGGFLIRDSRACAVTQCKAQFQWDGVDLVRSNSCTITRGDYSFNSNWGLHLWDASDNRFAYNRAIWCTTGRGMLFQAPTGWQTYDADGVLIEHRSNHNVILENDLRFGGDGIFIRANEGPTTTGSVVPSLNASNGNALIGNNCAFSPNNAIEVDLVDDTRIEHNNCSNSNYGLWLGYAKRCLVDHNVCINDSVHAIEIENGQDDAITHNVFGFDVPRMDDQLVYLRQNGRDTTPSAGYVLRNNIFFGSGTGLLLKDTAATVTGNSFVSVALERRMLVKSEGSSRLTEESTTVIEAAANNGSHLPAKPRLAHSLQPGTRVVMEVGSLDLERGTPVVEIDGIPVAATSAGKNEVAFDMPADMWDRPAPKTAEARVRRGSGWSPGAPVKLDWDPSTARITSVAPYPAHIGDRIVLTGANLRGGHLLLNGKPVMGLTGDANNMSFALPEGILIPVRYNLVWQGQEKADGIIAPPVSLAVDVPRDRMPHLLSALFSPTTLRVGDKLKVSFVVRNNLPSIARLVTKPAAGFTYAEKQAWFEMGVEEMPGTLHLRVTSDHPGAHDPGSWPWLFGFDAPQLGPGESATVTGYITMETPGEHEFRAGLVASGGPFIDDNAFRTKIHVEP